jgi:hypothetical protein
VISLLTARGTLEAGEVDLEAGVNLGDQLRDSMLDFVRRSAHKMPTGILCPAVCWLLGCHVVLSVGFISLFVYVVMMVVDRIRGE